MQKKPDVVVKKKSVSVILLAGGKGKRMGVSVFFFLLCLVWIDVELKCVYFIVIVALKV